MAYTSLGPFITQGARQTGPPSRLTDAEVTKPSRLTGSSQLTNALKVQKTSWKGYTIPKITQRTERSERSPSAPSEDLTELCQQITQLVADARHHSVKKGPVPPAHQLPYQ